MTTHIEIVSVTYRRGKAGERTPYVFEDYAINRPHPDDWPEDIACFDWHGQSIPTAHINDERLGGVYIDLPTDWFGLRFESFGQFFESEQSAMEWECENISAADVFEDYVDKLCAIGDQLLDQEISRRKTVLYQGDTVPHEVTFLTAWNYSCGKDWDGEWNFEYDLLGLIDLSKIKTLIIPAQAPQETAA